MSWINGLLVGAGEGLRRGSATYFSEVDRRKKEELAQSELVDRRMDAVRRAMLDADELTERKRSNRSQEGLEHERNVQGSLDRGLARENARDARDEGTRRAVEVALINADRARDTNAASNASHERVAGMPARTRPGGPAQTQSQVDGRMQLNRTFDPKSKADMAEKAELEAAWRKARAAFPNADPGDVMTAAKRYLDQIKKDRENRY